MPSVHSQEYQLFLKRLLQARLDSGLTQVQVSHMLNKPQSYISKIETGERRLDVVELAHIAKIYHKDLNYFVESIK